MNTIEEKEAAGVPKDAENGDLLPHRRRPVHQYIQQLSIAEHEGGTTNRPSKVQASS